MKVSCLSHEWECPFPLKDELFLQNNTFQIIETLIFIDKLTNATMWNETHVQGELTFFKWLKHNCINIAWWDVLGALYNV